jgi:hypothetical protein
MEIFVVMFSNQVVGRVDTCPSGEALYVWPCLGLSNFMAILGTANGLQGIHSGK